MYRICTKYTLCISKKLEVMIYSSPLVFKFKFSTLNLGKNGYFCACLNFFVNQCYLHEQAS